VAFAFIQELLIEGDDRSTTNYDAIAERLGARNNRPRVQSSTPPASTTRLVSYASSMCAERAAGAPCRERVLHPCK
jgi:hypothetical protein